MTSHIVARSLQIVGQHYIKDVEACSLLQNLAAEDSISAVHDKDNEYDHFAVSIRKGGVHLGFVPATLAPAIGILINSGAVITGTVQATGLNKAGNFSVDLHTELP